MAALGWLLNLDFGATASAAEAPAPASTPGGGRIIGAYTPKKRKFTKKDEKELKTLIIKAVEEDSNWRLVQKARELAEVYNAAKGISSAIHKAELEIIAMKKAGQISALEALQMIEEIEDEEDLILLLAEVI